MASAEEDTGSNSRPPTIASVVTTAVMDMDLPLPDAQPVVASAVTVPMIRKQAAVATQDQVVPQSRCPGLKLCTGCGHRSGPRAVKCPRCARSFYTQVRAKIGRDRLTKLYTGGANGAAASAAEKKGSSSGSSRSGRSAAGRSSHGSFCPGCAQYAVPYSYWHPGNRI